MKVKGGDVIKKKGSKDIMRSYMKFTKKNDMGDRVVRKRGCLELQRGQVILRNNKRNKCKVSIGGDMDENHNHIIKKSGPKDYRQ